MTAYPAEWRRLVAEAIASGAKCQDCGTRRNLEGDHELPVSKGGLSTKANLSIRCKRHNRAKGSRVTRYQLRIPWPYTGPGGTVADGKSNDVRSLDIAADTPITTPESRARNNTCTYESEGTGGVRSRREPDRGTYPAPSSSRVSGIRVSRNADTVTGRSS